MYNFGHQSKMTLLSYFHVRRLKVSTSLSYIFFDPIFLDTNVMCKEMEKLYKSKENLQFGEILEITYNLGNLYMAFCNFRYQIRSNFISES